MWTVALSGVVGRYFYSQIPRRISAAELTLAEINEDRAYTAGLLSEQDLFDSTELEDMMRLPSREEVAGTPLWRALLWMVVLDVSRPFKISQLRRRSMSIPMRILSLGGLLPLGNSALESVIRSVKRQFRLSTKLLFLSKTQRLFHL
ncbi:MAG: hypothetical protein R2748_16330 [Bryobacterales bacterium]